MSYPSVILSLNSQRFLFADKDDVVRSLIYAGTTTYSDVTYHSDMKNQEYSIKHLESTGSDSKGSRVRIRLQWAKTLKLSS